MQQPPRRLHIMRPGVQKQSLSLSRTQSEALVFVPSSHRRGVTPNPVRRASKGAECRIPPLCIFASIRSNPTCWCGLSCVKAARLVEAAHARKFKNTIVFLSPSSLFILKYRNHLQGNYRPREGRSFAY